MKPIIFLLSLLFAPLMCSGCALFDIEEAETPRFRTATAHYDKAMSYYQKGNYVKAKELLHEYIARYPNSELFRIALYYLGHCYQVLADEKEALTIFNRIVTTYGDDDFWGAQAMKRIKQIKGEE
jgi:TolA-binding protein